MPNNRPALFATRAGAAGRRLATLNEADRSVEFVAATADKVKVFDWDSWRLMDEVLLMAGRVDPPGRQVPLLDSHDGGSVDKQLGSYRDIRTEGQATVGRVHISATREDVFTKIKEGHLTDCSVGYQILEYHMLAEGESAEYEGRVIVGPCRVCTAWEIKELSICPIGADPAAKARTEYFKEASMSQKNQGRRENQPEDPNQPAQETEEERKKREAEEEEEQKRREEEEEERKRREDDPENEEGPEDDENKPEGERSGKRSPVLKERERVLAIGAMCREFGMPEGFAGKLIEKGVGVSGARKAVMDELKNSAAGGPGYGAVRVLADEKIKVRAALGDALMLRCGKTLDKSAPGAQDFRGYTLREMARECLVRAGHRPHGDVRDMVGRALTSTDLPILLTEASRRFLLDGFQEATETWHLWTGEGSVTDFREHKLIDASLDNTYEEVPAGGEYSRSAMDENAETYRIATFGRMFSIDRQAIINDDLGVLRDVPRKLGEGASRLIGDAVYGVLIANSAMSDGKALFHGDHKNILSGQGGVPTVETLGAADTAMGLQKDRQGRRLNIVPEFFLASRSLRTAAETFFNSELIGDSLRPNVRNLYHGKFERIYEPRLDDDDKDTWYLAARRDMGIRVFYLDGQKVPYLETREGWNVDGIEHKARLDVGVAPVSWLGLMRVTK